MHIRLCCSYLFPACDTITYSKAPSLEEAKYGGLFMGHILNLFRNYTYSVSDVNFFAQLCEYYLIQGETYELRVTKDDVITWPSVESNRELTHRGWWWGNRGGCLCVTAGDDDELNRWAVLRIVQCSDLCHHHPIWSTKEFSVHLTFTVLGRNYRCTSCFRPNRRTGVLYVGLQAVGVPLCKKHVPSKFIYCQRLA